MDCTSNALFLATGNKSRRLIFLLESGEVIIGEIKDASNDDSVQSDILERIFYKKP